MNNLIKIVLLAIFIFIAGCASMQNGGSWTTLIDGEVGLNNFNRNGDANWTAVEGAIQATSGSGSSHLVTKREYDNFIIRAEFWSSDDGNSGIHMRCSEPSRLSSSSCYEVNIFDQREDPRYGTGAIVNVAEIPEPRPKSGGKWSTMEITANGDHLVVIFNGMKTVDVRDSTHSKGVFGLQWGRGTIKFRKLEVREL